MGPGRIHEARNDAPHALYLGTCTMMRRIASTLLLSTLLAGCAAQRQSAQGDEIISTATARTDVAAPPPAPPPPPPPAPAAASAGDMIVTAQRRAGATRGFAHARSPAAEAYRPFAPMAQPVENRERYAGKEVSEIKVVAAEPISTFSIDVDTGSYANVRRMLTAGQTPPHEAARTEEMLNYFRYDYPLPTDRRRPFSVTTDMSTTPWNPATRLLRIGIRGYDIARAQRPAANLVFLVDVSGSMSSPDKLPLVKAALADLAGRIGPNDRVSIVTYAGNTRVALEPTGDPERIRAVLATLESGGSTAGASGLELAYAQARAARVPNGINRIILATDGDFNVGVSSTEALEQMIERQRDDGITLTTLGFGTGNYNDAMMERIADVGNGNYAYIDSALEAQKVLDDELQSTLFTIAKDVKIQIEFNPAYVSQYRLIGYENRALREQDFNNDRVDAGDIGAGHQVTAIYEIVPAGAPGWVEERRYEANQRPAGAGPAGEMAWLRLRYKLPDGDSSRLIEQPVAAGLIRSAQAPRGDMAFATAVAGFGQLLRGDTNLGRFGFADARALAGEQGSNYWRQEFLRLTRLAEARTPASSASVGE